MSSGCRFSVDSHAPPVRATYVNLYKWPESDVDFVRSVDGGGNRSNSRCGSRRRWVPGRPTVVDSYSCRQMYLRSYPFTKKESVPERTRRCLGKVKERAALFPSLSSLIRGKKSGGSHHRRRRQNKRGCLVVVVKKLRVASRYLTSSLFGRLLSCTKSH